MKIRNIYTFLLVIFGLMLPLQEIEACSMYKITVDGKTMVGCNHDAWLTTPKIWFETAKKPNEYGIVSTGSREVALNKTTPQSGMNTEGLTFSRLASYYPAKNNPFSNRLKIRDEADYLSDILHKCATIKEVEKYIEQYDHSFFLNDVFIYIDNLGDYLIVEPYKLIKGNNPNYVLANFCPSITDSNQARQIERYRNGEDFLNQNKAIASIDFCTMLSDTMSVCRKRNGDGTLITSVFDTKEKIVNVYFYHNFDTLLQYKLTDELSKGDHSLNLPEIFPKNAEFERLVSFKTPSNTITLRILLVIFAGLLALFSSILIVSQFWRNKYLTISIPSSSIISLVNLLLIVYIGILITNKEIFYFEVPYKHYNSRLISASSFTPFLLLALFIPITIYIKNSVKSNKTNLWIKITLMLNDIVYLLLLLGFGYWGLYEFWN